MDRCERLLPKQICYGKNVSQNIKTRMNVVSWRAWHTMSDDTIFIPIDGALATTLVKEIDLQHADESAGSNPCIALIERHTFLQEHIRRSMQSAFALPVVVYSSVAELEGQLQKVSPNVVILSLMQGNQASVSALKSLLELVPTVPVIVLASFDDVDLARTALRLGAKGYIPVANGFELAIEAVRFVFDGAENSA